MTLKSVTLGRSEVKAGRQGGPGAKRFARIFYGRGSSSYMVADIFKYVNHFPTVLIKPSKRCTVVITPGVLSLFTPVAFLSGSAA